jgi:hypothetical protein
LENRVVGVPRDVAAEATLAERRLGGKPTADDALFVPEVPHARVVEKSSRPPLARVRGHHVEPHGIDGYIELGVLFEKLLLRPPGAGDTDRSGGGEQQDESRLAGVALEGSLELVDRGDVPQCRRARGAARRCQQRSSENPGLT